MTRILSIQPVAERGGSDYCMLSVLRSLPSEKFACHVVVPSDPPLRREFEDAGATVHVVPMRRITTRGGPFYWPMYALAWPLAVVRLALLARRLRADVIHTNSLHSWYGWAVAVLLRKPHVWSAREIAVQSAQAARFERFLTRHFATVVVSMSKAIEAELVPEDGRKAHARFEVVYDDVDPERFRPDRAGTFRREHGIGDDVFLIGAAGRLDTWKGFDVLLEAFEILRSETAAPMWPSGTDVVTAELVVCGPAVAGKEDYADALAARAAAIPGVHWMGPVGDLAGFYADLDVFVLPSTEPEPFGLVLLEALASGTPVIATDHGGPVEIIGGCSGRGELVPHGDAEALADAMRRWRAESRRESASGPSCSGGSRRGSRPRLWNPAVPAYAAVFSEVTR